MTPFKGDWPNSLFASQDPVAIDSVGLDFWLQEQPVAVNQGKWEIDYEGAAEDYLHEAALANDPCSGTFYDPDNDGNVGLTRSIKNRMIKLYRESDKININYVELTLQ